MIAFVLTTLLAQALAPPPSEMTTVGRGSESCIRWTEHKRIGGGAREADTSWIAGFLTGVEFENRGMGGKPLLRLVDKGDAYIAYIDLHCAAHPLDSVAEAAQMLWLELSRRARRTGN